MDKEVDKLNELAHDVVSTSGSTIRMILEDPEVIAYLGTRQTKSGYSLAEHVQCAQAELDAYDEQVEKIDKENKHRR